MVLRDIPEQLWGLNWIMAGAPLHWFSCGLPDRVGGHGAFHFIGFSGSLLCCWSLSNTLWSIWGFPLLSARSFCRYLAARMTGFKVRPALGNMLVGLGEGLCISNCASLASFLCTLLSACLHVWCPCP